MELQLNIEFNQLVKIAKKLPARQWLKLKGEVENIQNSRDKDNEMESFLLNAPCFTQKQINEIENARKSLNLWRNQ